MCLVLFLIFVASEIKVVEQYFCPNLSFIVTIRTACPIMRSYYSYTWISIQIANFGCYVFWPTNKCSACHLLVEIICFCIKTSFLSFSVTDGIKERKQKGKLQNKQLVHSCVFHIHLHFNHLLLNKTLMVFPLRNHWYKIPHWFWWIE